MNNSTGGAEAPVTSPLNANSFLFFGIALLILGVIAIGSQFLFTIGTVIFFGALMLMAGVAELVHIIASKKRNKMIFNILSSLAYIVTGCLTLWNPLVGALSITFIMSVFFILAGAVRVTYGLFHTNEARWGWFVLGGIINFALGLMVMAGWPATGLWMIGLFVGVEMIFYGTSWIMLAMVLKSSKTGA